MLNKFTLLSVLFVAMTVSSFAQISSSATQTIHLQVQPALEIQNNSKRAGNNNMNVSVTKTDKTNQEFTVRSNKEFIVSVKADGSNVGDNLLMALANNNTGGQASAAFSQNGYVPVNGSSQDLLTNCTFGNERSFAVNYKTKNNKAKAQPLTKADIIYTATLP